MREIADAIADITALTLFVGTLLVWMMIVDQCGGRNCF